MTKREELRKMVREQKAKKRRKSKGYWADWRNREKQNRKHIG